jgi:phospholipid/cholesterol/gamma-HCH transport system substrate-binding protein
MNVKSYERLAGLFVIGAIASVFIFTFSIGFEQGWFVKKRDFFAKVPQVEGVYSGTRVQIGGLRIGRVNKVQLQDDGTFLVHFVVFEKYAHQFTDQTIVGFIRPYIIGERVLDVSPSEEGSQLTAGSEVQFTEHFDILDTFNGKKLGPYMENMQALLENIRFLAEAFADRKRSEDLVEIFDNMKPLIINANRATKTLDEMASQMTNKKNLKVVISNLATTTTAINTSINEIVAFSKQLPTLGEHSTVVMKNLTTLTLHLNDLVPTIQAIAPELPNASKKALKALEEALVVLQAMQKSFVLRGSVAEVKEEEAEAKKEEEKRKISSEKEKND